jgi:multiple sugar transport system substrate-binding protein
MGVSPLARNAGFGRPLLLDQVAAGVGPDIITGTLPVQLIERGLVETIDDHLTPEEREDFFDPALDAFSYEGKTYGWPWYLTGSVMFLNLDLFETAGVKPPGADWTYQEFLDAARQLSRDSDSDGESDTHGFGFLIRPGDTSAWPFIFPDDAGSLAENPTELPVLNTTGRAGLGRLHRLIHEEEVAPVQSAAWDTIALWQSFADRRNIAMAPWGIWAIPKLCGPLPAHRVLWCFVNRMRKSVRYVWSCQDFWFDRSSRFS